MNLHHTTYRMCHILPITRFSIMSSRIFMKNGFFLSFNPAVTAVELGFSLQNLESAADFDRHILGQIRYAHCRTGMFSVFTKNLHGKFAGAIQYGRLFVESGDVRGFVHAYDLDRSGTAQEMIEEKGESSLPTASETIAPSEMHLTVPPAQGTTLMPMPWV